MQQRIIAHFDLDAFFVNVALLTQPQYRGQPIIIGGSSTRGVVSTCSYEARAFGVTSGMPMVQATRLCPQAILLNAGHGEYGKYSKLVTDIIAAHAPLFEKASVDEFYLDLTGMDTYYDVLQWTINLRQLIITETKLPISFGLASNKMVAKIATDIAKPNGYLQVQYGMERAFLAPLSVNKIGGVGASTYASLQAMGIHTIGDITKYSVEQLEEKLGKHGTSLWHKAHGTHLRAVTPYHEAKSISSETTFATDTCDVTFLQQQLIRLTEKVLHELRADDKMATSLTLKLRYKGFETTSKQVTITATWHDHDVIPQIKLLLTQLYRKGELVRLIGVKVSNLVLPVQQTNLFVNNQKLNNLYKAIDGVKDTFGKKILQRAGGKAPNN